MQQSSRNKRLAELPDGNDPPASGALSNSSHVGDDHPIGDRSLAELRRIVRESELLRKIAVKANEAATADEAIQACLDEVCGFTGWPVGHAYMPATDGTDELETTKLWHIDDPERYENFRRVTEATHYTSDQSLPSRVMVEATPQWMVSNATYQHFPRANARIEAGIKSGFAFPAMAGKAVVAVLEFFSPDAIESDPQFLSVTAEIGILIGQVIERKLGEHALVESHDQLRLITDNLPVLIAYFDAQQRYCFVNKTSAVWHARPAEDILGRTVSEILGQEYEKVRPRIDRTLAGEQVTYVDSVTYPDGVTRTVRATNVPHLDAAGSVVGYFTIMEDITELQKAEEALRQAQKMEAVGQLTGGVAHDFNNLLAVILGNTELLQEEIGDNSRLASIDHAATRGAELTQRLLAFSRQQALQPQSIDLTELVPGLHDLLQRTLGEPVKILTHVPEGIWQVLADPGQLENALLNLSINARDAMPDGGTLEIWCSNIELQEGDLRVSDKVAAGDYVQIAVRDTGTGIPEDVLERVFDPFFTTKGVGEGSGLGLSMVHGFARQSGGDAVIESAPGKGTEVRLFLPRAETNAASEEPTREEARKRGQSEIILVLEDDPDVRSFVVEALEGLSYRVLEATDATAAMRILEEEAGKVDLLLCDVVLPGGVSGPEFAAKAKGLYPKLKIVFMSGYAADLYTHDKIPGFDETLLSKPFRLAYLAKVVHDTLTA